MNRQQGKRERRLLVFKERVQAWTEKLRVHPTQVRVQEMTRKWASCSPTGWITFSKALFNKPPAFQDYVILHELLHMRIPNHGKLFRSLLSAYLPGWRRIASRHHAGL